MRDHPIIFSAPMVRALLAGRKTQTRRLAWRAYAEEISGDKTRMVPTKASHWQRVQPGDRLWVREAWADPTSHDPGPVFWRADFPACVPSHYENVPPSTAIRWRPSIHMPRWASRITLHVEAVRVERLQDISRGDAIAEGVRYPPEGMTMDEACEYGVDPRGTFRQLWSSLHGPDAWASNPEVVVLKFSVVRGNVDA